ncbi:MAG: patatin-like phospholipase family protein [Piscinibacter sp.]|uniref:patatin-like phospholipase family protein n=1 Tax=Piscinibacter sp. TaxID=1903157 RepID=UPI003D122232
MSPSRRRLMVASAASCALPVVMLQGCANAPALPPIPAELVDVAEVPGFRGIRAFGDGSGRKEMDLWGTGGPSGFTSHDAMAGKGPLRVLAISGGGSNGAFGAGVLAGWSETGQRPEFDIVTGVSVGALAAPYAFLGPGFDAQMSQLFTGLSSENIVKPRPRLLALFNDALASSQPLRELIAQHFDAGMMRAVAREHLRGRRLFVGTTHVYASRQVTWDLGAIASTGKPEALALIHQILLASASVPILLPPVYLEVEAGGRRFHEMHMDGSLTRQLFVWSPAFDWAKVMQAHRHRGRPEFYAIRNGRAKSEYMVMPPNVAALGEHAMYLMSQSQGVADLYVVYTQAQRAGAQFRAAWIGDDFEASWDQWYDPRYVQSLFAHGRTRAASGEVWRSAPPGFEAGAPGATP